MNETTETNETNSEILTAEMHPPGQPLVPLDSPLASLLNETLRRPLATAALNFSKSQLVPKHFQGKPYDVFIALHQALVLNCDFMTLMQNMQIINGQPGYRASFVIAQAERAKAFGSPIRWRVQKMEPPILEIERRYKDRSGEWQKKKAMVPNLSVTAYAKDKFSGQEISHTITMKNAVDDGWTDNEKYTSMGEAMLMYRTATMLVRLYAPACMMVQTLDEIEDITASGKAVTIEAPEPSAEPTTHELNARLRKSNTTEAVDTVGSEPAKETEAATGSEPAAGSEPANTELPDPAEIARQAILNSKTLEQLEAASTLISKAPKAGRGALVKLSAKRYEELSANPEAGE